MKNKPHLSRYNIAAYVVLQTDLLELKHDIETYVLINHEWVVKQIDDFYLKNRNGRWISTLLLNLQYKIGVFCKQKQLETYSPRRIRHSCDENWIHHRVNVLKRKNHCFFYIYCLYMTWEEKNRLGNIKTVDEEKFLLKEMSFRSIIGRYLT